MEHTPIVCVLYSLFYIILHNARYTVNRKYRSNIIIIIIIIVNIVYCFRKSESRKLFYNDIKS